MNIAIILAGGCGKRTEQDIPKQFFNVYDKPIIMYTLEAFQKHPEIDGIIVSCLEGWEEILYTYAKEYKIEKLKWVITGGENGQSSARKALEALRDVCKGDDIIVIHDAVRPMVSDEMISDCIITCKHKGNGLSAIRCQETIVQTSDGISGNVNIHRDGIMRVQTPQAYFYEKAMWVHQRALQAGITDAVYTNTLMLDMGECVYFSKGSTKNIKITTMEDVEIFKALCMAKKDEWVK